LFWAAAVADFSILSAPCYREGQQIHPAEITICCDCGFGTTP